MSLRPKVPRTFILVAYSEEASTRKMHTHLFLPTNVTHMCIHVYTHIHIHTKVESLPDSRIDFSFAIVNINIGIQLIFVQENESLACFYSFLNEGKRTAFVC